MNSSLSEYGKKLTVWFLEKQASSIRLIINDKFRPPHECSFSSLKILSQRLSYDIVANITDRQNRCLMAVYGFMDYNLDEDKKLEYLKIELGRI